MQFPNHYRRLFYLLGKCQSIDQNLRWCLVRANDFEQLHDVRWEKCAPINRSGLRISDAHFANGKLVGDIRAQYAAAVSTIDSNVANIFLFKSKFSIMTSMTISTFAKVCPPRSLEDVKIALAFSGFHFTFFNHRFDVSFDRWMLTWRNSGLISFNTTSMPLKRHAVAIHPHQTTTNNSDAFHLARA